MPKSLYDLEQIVTVPGMACTGRIYRRHEEAGAETLYDVQWLAGTVTDGRFDVEVAQFSETQIRNAQPVTTKTLTAKRKRKTKARSRSIAALHWNDVKRSAAPKRKRARR